MLAVVKHASAAWPSNNRKKGQKEMEEFGFTSSRLHLDEIHKKQDSTCVSVKHKSVIGTKPRLRDASFSQAPVRRLHATLT